uniref:WD domain-containing protein, G-beta repeat-containing protein n=1 Tax=Candidatus Kentrum sp. FM TaxID=2126340 RepID=A0A450SRV0_9GAMM|nr:MAG: WD domain-containing protein, G-beta repeat-containing protein [Candidatus Kentron sp. FM]VFJ57085.1 MAG: WD domain-containing protein, G-beta repeat-containing protein [Candidatus Kentron sp. FM]VFK11470.1 MAG: WD domain-containing protein, G-beta repeat-containing protein [Candidatus Kentron sp. FM]
MKFQLPNLPTFPATPTGLESAIRAFLTEQGAARPITDPGHAPTGNPPERLDARVESLLGDALPWAQDCAMFQPAIPLGLADALRRRFYPQLPPDRLGRFFALPDTLSTAAGIRFSTQVLAILHRGFNQRRGDAPGDGAAAVRASPRVRPPSQDAVLAFFQEEIDKAKPALKDGETPGLAYLKWESVRERLRLEAEADNDLKRLAELTDPASPLSDSLLAGLEHYALEDGGLEDDEPGNNPGNDPDKIPLRLAPKNPKARQRLAALAGNPFKIRKLAAFPLTYWQKTLLGVLLLSFVGLAGMGVVEYRAEEEPVDNFELVRDVPVDYRLKAVGMQIWSPKEAQTQMSVPRGWRLTEETEHHLTLYENGHRTMEAFTTPDAGQGTRIHVKSRDEAVPCRAAFPEMGLTVMRCSDQDARSAGLQAGKASRVAGAGRGESPVPSESTPGSPRRRVETSRERMLIALEFADGNTPELPTLPALREELWQTGELDILYRLRPIADGAGNQEWKTAQLFAAMATDLGPWIEDSRLLWWNAANSVTVFPYGSPKFAQTINIPADNKENWRAKLAELFPPARLEKQNYEPLSSGKERVQAVLKTPYANWRALRKTKAHSKAICWPHCLEFAPDGGKVLSGSYDGTLLKLWDVASGKKIRTFKGHSNWIRSVAFSPNGRTVLSGSADNTLKLWNVANGKAIHTFKRHHGAVWSVTFAPDGRTVLSGGADKAIKLWDVTTKRLLRTLKGHTSYVVSVSFAPDGLKLLSGSYDDTLKLWDTKSGKTLHTFVGHSNDVYSVAFSPDGRMVLSGSGDNTLRLWNTASGKMIRAFKGHTNRVRSVAFSPDGRTILSGSDDSMLKLWDVASGREIRTLEGHSDNIYSVAFSPDGKRAISGDRYGVMILWGAE